MSLSMIAGGRPAPSVSRSGGEDEGPFLPCFRCGICCTRYRVRLSLVEARRLADGLGLAWDDFLRQYIDRHYPGAQDFPIRQCNGACIFLKPAWDEKKADCLIHPFKPSACRQWTPSLFRHDCREGLETYWGLQVGPSGQPQGREDKVRDFHSFLESLRNQ